MLESDGEVDEKSLKNADFDDPLWKIGAYVCGFFPSVVKLILQCLRVLIS